MAKTKRANTLLAVSSLMNGAADFLEDAAALAQAGGETATVARLKRAADAIKQAKADTLADYSAGGQRQ